jgi:hypothetical protein
MTLIWPYPTRDPSMFRRIDQGWDLQVPVGTPIFAVADGTISYAHDPAGFGDPYPVLTLDVADVSVAVYYGHNHPEVGEGAHVHQGDVIAHALAVPGGNASSLPGWLEIGWWNGGPTGNGQAMHDVLINAPIWEEDMPLSQADKDAVAQETANAVHQLLNEFWNNQFSPALVAIKTEVDAIKAKTGA